MRLDHETLKAIITMIDLDLKQNVESDFYSDDKEHALLGLKTRLQEILINGVSV